MHAVKQKLLHLARKAPWWGISLLVHAIVVLILMNWKVDVRMTEVEFPAVRIARIRPPEKEKPPVDVASHVVPKPPDVEPPIEKQDFRELVDSRALDEAAKMGETKLLAVEGSTFGERSPGGRKRAVEDGGGATTASENAVESGLLWLAGKQLATGGWRAETEGARWADPGISGLATMAFLGAGYTHKGGKFLRTVDRAIGYLKSRQDREGCIAYTDGGKRIGGYMYCHPMATLALVEAYGMTKDPLLQEPAQRAIDFIVQTQNSTGGWRYYANSPDGDSSISGWMIMALRSASLSGLDVPTKAFTEARRFFDSVTDKAQGKTFYLPSKLPMGMALNAVGLLCHQYLGMAADDPFIERAGAVINANPPKWMDRDTVTAIPLDKLALLTSTNNYYYWYYANLALHQRRGKAWDKWHPQVKDLLCRLQERQGDREGSWSPLTYGGTTGGRVYSTALAVLSLEVYYRYAPLYRDTVDEVLAAYGDALGAYNHFARTHAAKKPEAEDARKGAIERLSRFLALSESKTETKDPAKTAERRGQAALMLVRLHRAGGELQEAITLLKSLPDRFPNLLTTAELVRWLADLYRARAQQLAAEGDAAGASKAKAAAVNLLYPLVSQARGKDPELELWLANAFFEREDWQKAVEFYAPQLGRVNFKRLDPKSEEGSTVVAILDRLIRCCVNLRQYKPAAQYLEQLEKLVGTSLAIRRQHAELCRLRKDYTAARRIYDGLLERLPEFGKEWWETKHEQLFMAYREDRGDYVVKSIGMLQISHPSLGGEDLKPRFLDLLSRAQNGKAPAKTVPDSSF
ncbi:MAG TPA: tetratricopeptide repeat protein [Planctomycetota bacterium]|nr:tetratricopeptide repeat protein [Planctomycetota bacterium]